MPTSLRQDEGGGCGNGDQDGRRLVGLFEHGVAIGGAAEPNLRRPPIGSEIQKLDVIAIGPQHPHRPPIGVSMTSKVRLLVTENVN